MKSTNKIKEKKIETTIIELSRGLPLQFQKLFESIRNIGFEDTPDYSLLRTLLAEMFNEKGYENDFMYDWIIKSQKIAKQNKIHSQLIDRSKDEKIDNHNLKVRNENEHVNHKRPNNEDSNQIDIINPHLDLEEESGGDSRFLFFKAPRVNLLLGSVKFKWKNRYSSQ